MILVQIDTDTGLVIDKPGFDGWKAVPELNKVYQKHGIKAITVIALINDYMSPQRYYNNEDRPKRCLEVVYGDRNAMKMDQAIFINASEKYLELQMDADLEMEKINREIKIRLLNQLRTANKNNDDSAIEKYSKALSNHEDRVKKFNEKFNIIEVVDRAVTSSGYVLSRIENDIKSRKDSKFTRHGEGAKNPNTLGLNSKT